jgi:gluconolactonase
MNRNFLLSLLVFMIACNSNTENKKQEMKYKKHWELLSALMPALDNIISVNAKPEIIADGFEWSEGPLWVEQHNMLLFSDVPMNTI